MNAAQQQSNNAELNAVAQAYYGVECRKKEFFFSTSATRQGIIVEEERLDSDELLLLSRLLPYCRVSDNTLFGLISNYYFATNLSTSENKLTKERTKVISTRVTERFANLVKQYCQEDAYINCSDFIRDALREKLRKDASDRFKRLLDGGNTA